MIFLLNVRALQQTLKSLKKQQLPVPLHPSSAVCAVWWDEEEKHKHHSCQNLEKINIFRGREAAAFPQNVQENSEKIGHKIFLVVESRDD